MNIQEYYLGEPVRLKASFADLDDVPTDPTTVTLIIEDPEGEEEDYTFAASQVVNDSPGNYHYDVVPSMSGRWLYRWESTGAVQTVKEFEFFVRPSVFVP